MSALINVFAPEWDESDIGYIRRLAAENHYPDWRNLLRATHISPSRHAVRQHGPEIAVALALELEWIERLTTPPTPTALDDLRYQRTIFDPICPLCLRDKPYVRRGWSHCFATACSTHGVELIDCCPSCGQALVHNRHGIAHCDCGYDLREVSPPRASAWHQWISARLAGDAKHVEGTAELGNLPDYAKLHRLLFLLAVRADPEKKVDATEVSLPRLVEEAKRFLAPVIELLTDWPNRFSAHVATRFMRGDPHHYNLSGRLGPWYLTLSALCNRPPAFESVWRAFSDAVIDTFDGNLRGQNTLRPSPGKQRKFVSVAEAARQIGTAHASLTAAAKKGAVKAHITRQGVAYELIMIERTEVDRIRSARERWIMESDAAEMLGVTASVVIGLKRAGILRFEAKWTDDFQKGGPIHIDTVFELINRVQGHMVERPVTEAIPFSRLTGRRTTDGHAMTRLYKAIVDGEVRAVGHDFEHGLGGFLFETNEVRNYLGSIALEDGFTLTQLEKASGWKYEALSHWVNEGYLVPTSVKLHGRTARVISLASLMAFRRAWIPVSDAAHELQTIPSALTKKLMARGIEIHGQKALPDGVKRGGLVRMKDIAAVLTDGG